MLSQRTANLVFVTALLAASGYFEWVAEGVVTSGLLGSSGLPSKSFPHLMLGAMALCALIVGFQYLTRGGAGGDEGQSVFDGAGAALRGPLMLVVSVICYFVWKTYRFVPMAVILGPLSLLAMRVRAPLIYVTVLVLSALIWAVFTYGLGIQLV